MRLLHQNEDEQGNQRKPGKKSSLSDVFERVKAVLWTRNAGHCVNKTDLWVEFCHQRDVIMKEIEARRDLYGRVTHDEMKLHDAIADRRASAHQCFRITL